MGNNAAKIVSSLIAGTRTKAVVLGGEIYTINSPTLRTICLSISEFSKVDIDLNTIPIEHLQDVPQAVDYMCKGIAYLIANGSETTAQHIANKIKDATPEELKKAFEAFLSMASLKEVFLCAASVRKYTEAAANQK